MYALLLLCRREVSTSLARGAPSLLVQSIWDLGGSKDFLDMLPMVCVDAVAVLFLFDLSNPSSLSSVREWYRQVRLLNKSALPFLVGCKFDVFYEMDASQQEAITKQARKFARAMKAPLILNSSKEVINVQKIFKLVFCQVFNVTPTIPEVTDPGMPIIEYKSAMAARASSASSAASSSGPGGDEDGESGGRG